MASPSTPKSQLSLRDVHSPRHRGFLYSHLGWIFSRTHTTASLVKVADFTRSPELMWLHKYELLPAVFLAVLCFLLAGWSGLVVGFFWSTVLLYHATFFINSLAHVHGSKRYVTGDDSRNNWFLAIFSMGEGWHNNHHAYQSSARQGFRWWEIDLTYYILRVLSWFGVILIAAMSIFFMPIIASNARFASSPPTASASVSTRDVICQDAPFVLHQPHSLSCPPIADDGVPVAVGLLLILGGDLEREGFAMFERETAVKADTRDARQL